MIGNIPDGGTLVLRACTLRNMLDDPEELASEHPGVLLDQCSVERFMSDHTHWDTLVRDLNDLFPGWKEALR